MRLVKSVLMFLALVPLAGCSNRVVSETPWFRATATETGPRLREGVWRYEDVRCTTNESAPAERWPSCALWSYRRANQSLSPQWQEEGAGRQRIRTYSDWSVREDRLVDGDPMIVQNDSCAVEQMAPHQDDVATDIPDSASGSPASDAPPHGASFCYDAMRATAFDATGRITAVETWPVLCGPWPRNGGKVTDQPWPGLSLFGDNCTAASEAALRDAAKRSRDVAQTLESVSRLHWVRDGYH